MIKLFKDQKITDHKKSKWLTVFCPDDACLTEEEQIFLPESEAVEKRSLWLEIFCPEDSCKVTSPTQLP